MLTVRGVYDGRAFRPLPFERIPRVRREVPVAIVFLEDVAAEDGRAQRQIEVAERMRAARSTMALLPMSVKDLVEAGRER
jgi:hypothetical protein